MIKQELNTKYGKFIMNACKSGETYADTDSFKIKPVRVVSRDTALCMYDLFNEMYNEIYEVLNNEKR